MPKKKIILFKSSSGSGHFYTFSKIKKKTIKKFDPVYKKYFKYYKK